MPEHTDVLLDDLHDLLWKRTGPGSRWMYCGPVVVPAIDRSYRQGEKDQESPTRREVATLVACVPDDPSTYWVFSWAEFGTENANRTVRCDKVKLPLRFRGSVYEEGFSRAKQHLVDRLFPELPPERRYNAQWAFDSAFGSWTLQLGGRYNWTFGDGEATGRHTRIDGLDAEKDACAALAAAVKATEAARMEAACRALDEKRRLR